MKRKKLNVFVTGNLKDFKNKANWKNEKLVPTQTTQRKPKFGITNKEGKVKKKAHSDRVCHRGRRQGVVRQGP